MIDRVSTIAVLLVLQGMADLVLGLALLGTGLFVAVGGAGLPPSLAPLESRVAVLVFGPVLTAAGVLKIVAGVRNYRYRSPLLGIVALASALVSALNCACLPLALPLAAYGLYLYRQPAVERAFQMGSQGLSRQWIRHSARP